MARNGADFQWNAYMMAEDRDRPMREYANPWYCELNPTIVQPEVAAQYYDNDCSYFEALTDNFYGSNTRVVPRKKADGIHELDILTAKVESVSNLMKTMMDRRTPQQFANDIPVCPEQPRQNARQNGGQNSNPLFQLPVFQKQSQQFHAPQQPVCERSICPEVHCVFCGGSHIFDNCSSNPESVFYMDDKDVNHANWYSNACNRGWRTHQPFMCSGEETNPSREQLANEFWNQEQDDLLSDFGDSSEESENYKVVTPQIGEEFEAVEKLSGKELESEVESEENQKNSVENLMENVVPEQAQKFCPQGQNQEKFTPQPPFAQKLQEQIQEKSDSFVETNQPVVEDSIGNFVENSVPTKIPPSITNGMTLIEGSNFLLKSRIPEMFEDPILLQQLDHLMVYPKRKIGECLVFDIFVVKSSENEVLLFYDMRLHEFQLVDDESDEGEQYFKFNFIPKEVPKRKVIKWHWMENEGLSRWWGLSRAYLHTIG